MANQLQTDFIFNSDTADRKIDATKKNLFALNNDLNNVARNTRLGDNLGNQLSLIDAKADKLTNSLKNISKVSIGKGFDSMSKSALDTSKDVFNVKKQITDLRKIASEAPNANIFKQLSRESEKLEKVLDRVDSKVNRFGGGNSVLTQKKSRTDVDSSSQLFKGVERGVGVPIGLTALSGIGSYAAVEIGKEIFNLTKADEDSRRALNSSARNASVFDAQNQAVNFANLSGQSLADGSSQYAKFLDFSNRAGSAGKTALLGQSVADLAASKNLKLKDVSDLNGEDFKKLTGRQETDVLKTYAATVGTTSEKLTEAQKEQAKMNELIRQGSLVNGEAEKKLNSLGGSADKVGVVFTNIGVAIGDKVKPVIKDLLGDITALDNFLRTGKVTPEKPKFDLDATVKSLRDQEDAIANAKKNPFSNVRNYALSQLDLNKFKADGLSKESLFQDDKGNFEIRSEKQPEVIARREKLIQDEVGKTVDLLERKKVLYSESLKDPRSSLGLLRLERRDFNQFKNLLDPDTKNKLENDFATTVSSGVNKGFQKGLKDAFSLKDLYGNLNKITSSTELLPDTRENLVEQIESQARQKFEQVKNLKTEFRDFIVSTKSNDNPFVKLFSDIDTVGERAEKRFKSLGKEAVKFAADAEKAALGKKLNELRFDTNLQSLKYTQDARRVDQLPFSQTNEFTQSLSSIERNVQHIADSTDLSRKSNEASFYANFYNPNNPKSFDEFQRGGFNDLRGATRERLAPVFASNLGGVEVGARNVFTGLAGAVGDFSEVGKQIFNAKDEFKKLDALSAGASGLYGQETIANRKLSLLPDNNELLKRLNSFSAGIREDAQFALNQKADAFKIKRSAEDKRFNDSFDLQEFQNLRQKDFKEQIGLLQNSTGLGKEFAAKNALNIASELGLNNLDKQGLNGYRSANLELAQISQNKEREGERDREAQRARDTKFDNLLDNIKLLFGAKGLKVEIGDQQVVYLQIENNDPGARVRKSGLPRAPSPQDVANLYLDGTYFNQYQQTKK